MLPPKQYLGKHKHISSLEGSELSTYINVISVTRKLSVKIQLNYMIL